MGVSDQSSERDIVTEEGDEKIQKEWNIHTMGRICFSMQSCKQAGESLRGRARGGVGCFA